MQDLNRKIRQLDLWIEPCDRRIVPNFYFAEKDICHHRPRKPEFASYIGQVLSTQGAAAASAQSLSDGQDVVVNTLQQSFNTASGVNVDNEMSNLLTLQTAYSANARVLTTINQMFTTLLQAFAA